MDTQHRLTELLKTCLPATNHQQVTARYYLESLFSQQLQFEWVLDLGCGLGSSLDYFRQKSATIRWVGLDITGSPEVVARTRTDGAFYTFDGIHIPFPNDFFDLVYCHQVLEHVRYPAPLLAEVQRVLKPGGYFVGSTSHLEPYHSFSTWNYTPYGFYLLVVEAELSPVEIRPGLDALTLMLRRGLGRPNWFNWWWKHESPLNLLINTVGRLGHKSSTWINATKLLFCGQFAFLVRKET